MPQKTKNVMKVHGREKLVGIVSVCQKGSGRKNGFCKTIWIDMDTPSTGSISPNSRKICAGIHGYPNKSCSFLTTSSSSFVFGRTAVKVVCPSLRFCKPGGTISGFYF